MSRARMLALLLALAVLSFGCGRIGFDALRLTEGDAGADGGSSADGAVSATDAAGAGTDASTSGLDASEPPTDGGLADSGEADDAGGGSPMPLGPCLASSPSVTVIAPDGGESLVGVSEVNVTFAIETTSDYVQVQLWEDYDARAMGVSVVPSSAGSAMVALTADCPYCLAEVYDLDDPARCDRSAFSFNATRP